MRLVDLIAKRARSLPEIDARLGVVEEGEHEIVARPRQLCLRLSDFQRQCNPSRVAASRLLDLGIGKPQPVASDLHFLVGGPERVQRDLDFESNLLFQVGGPNLLHPKLRSRLRPPRVTPPAVEDWNSCREAVSASGEGVV